MKKTITLSIATVSALALMSFGVLSSSGKANKTGGHGEGTCGDCHNPSAAAGVTVGVTANGNLLTAGYVTGTTYTINVTIAQASQPLFGFDFQALNASNANAGTLTAGVSGDNKKVTSGTIDNIEHNGTGGLGTGTYTYSFTWTAPATNIGNVTFYYIGMASNNDSDETVGDDWNNGSVVISCASGISDHAVANINLAVFPNPVSESAKISYELTENSTVSATLINVTGQVVATFFNKEEQVAGKQSKKLLIDPAIAKGIYFVAINVNGKNSYKKIVVD